MRLQDAQAAAGTSAGHECYGDRRECYDDHQYRADEPPLAEHRWGRGKVVSNIVHWSNLLIYVVTLMA